MAKDKTYRYSGPLSGVTLADGREVMFHPGGEVVLPADNDYVRSLIAQGRLTEVAPPPASPRKGKEEDNAG